MEIATDITERKQAEAALRESEETFRVHIENSFDVIFTLNSEGIFVFISPAWERHFGYPTSDVIGKSFAPFVHPDDVPSLFEYLKRVLFTGQSETSPAYRVKHANGGWLWLVANSTPYVNTKGERQFIGVGRDITEQKRAEDALTVKIEELRDSEKRYRDLSIVDDLTQLYNSRYFYNQLKMEIDRVDRYEQPLTLILLDLDDFKAFNDALRSY
jgi:PAS domain S-box-containing protein